MKKVINPEWFPPSWKPKESKAFTDWLTKTVKTIHIIDEDYQLIKLSK